MLRFAVYDDHGPAKDWPLDAAYLVGPDDIAVRGELTFKAGQIRCTTRANHTVGLCLPYDAGPLGRLMLQTCLLPDRDRPYLLSLEFARHRIKTFIAKSEEWQMFELESDHPAPREWEKARKLFSEALNEKDPIQADRLAQRSLVHAVQANERLALAHAEIFLHWRFGKRPAPSATLGVRIHTGKDTSALRDLLTRDFDILVFPLRWSELEVEEGRYDWAPLDRWVQWAQTQDKPCVLGPLLDFSKRALPKWMYVWQHDYSTCRDLVYEHVERVVKRYGSAVDMWNVASGLNVNDNFQFTAQQMIDLTYMGSLIVRQVHKGARTMVEIVEPFGEFGAANKNAVAPLTYLDQIVQEGIPMDCVGVQLLFGQKGRGRETRDLMQISSLLDRFLTLDLPVLISAVGVPSEAPEPGGGWWHEPWTAQVQSRWVSRAFSIAMSKPFVESVIWSDLYDHPSSDLPGAGLVDASGRTKPALQRLVGMRKRLRKPLGPPRRLSHRVSTGSADA